MTQIALLYSSYAYGITCYECFSGTADDCLKASVPCIYGLFGCIKTTIYSGGIDKFGNYENQQDRTIGMYRGCVILPMADADICQQISLFGYRIVTCHCFNDLCNGIISIQTNLPVMKSVSGKYCPSQPWLLSLESQVNDDDKHFP
ncbi:Stall [Dirofilaria immitis]|nr:Stall [Dirofilaria immitis]